MNCFGFRINEQGKREMKALRFAGMIVMLVFSTIAASPSTTPRSVDESGMKDGLLVKGSLVSSAESTISIVHLSIPPTYLGGVTEAQVSIDSFDEVHSFNLLLQFEPNELVSADVTDFRRNSVHLPEVNLGDHSLNAARNAGLGRIRIIGLAPEATIGSAEIGYLRLHISPNASIGATQTITLAGEINYADTGVVAIEPVVAVVRVIEIN
jgi:hypothetical protein